MWFVFKLLQSLNINPYFVITSLQGKDLTRTIGEYTVEELLQRSRGTLIANHSVLQY